MILALVLLLASLTANPCASLKSMEGTDGPPGNLDDGPHVYWRNDTTAVVFSFIGGRLVQETFTASDTVRFQGSLDGTAVSFAIPTIGPSRVACDTGAVPRFLAVSDVHGDFPHFREILLASGVMDDSFRWTWGEGHLVVLGDIMDRGPAVTECLWLVYLLAQQAERAGGAVHFVLGNHELMVLLGDLRYVHERYLDGISGVTGMDCDDLFGPDMELGRWIRSRPAVVRMGDILFVHGGIAPGSGVDELSLPEINELVWRGLERSSVGYLLDGVERVFGSLGPLWFRGYHYGMEGLYLETTAEEVAILLDRYEVERIVVGHTEHDSLAVLFGGRVVAIDVPVDCIGGQQALLREASAFYRVNADGSRVLIP
ncbi:MAG: metallophosphoesterase [Candidatus Fermentibacteraceae bacterium]